LRVACMNGSKMNVLQLLLSLTCLTVLGLFSGCAVKVERPIETLVALPTSFSDSGSSALSGKWWLAFEDGALNNLIEQSLNDNFS
jgi:outer membrane protein TolC